MQSGHLLQKAGVPWACPAHSEKPVRSYVQFLHIPLPQAQQDSNLAVLNFSLTAISLVAEENPPYDM